MHMGSAQGRRHCAGVDTLTALHGCARQNTRCSLLVERAANWSAAWQGMLLGIV